jgi:hypothetical protein
MMLKRGRVDGHLSKEEVHAQEDAAQSNHFEVSDQKFYCCTPSGSIFCNPFFFVIIRM